MLTRLLKHMVWIKCKAEDERLSVSRFFQVGSTSLRLFMSCSHCSSLISQALCINNVEKYWLYAPDCKSVALLIEWNSFFKAISPQLCSAPLIFLYSFIWNKYIFHVSLSVIMYLSVCCVLLIWIKQTASINLNSMFISSSDGFFLPVQGLPSNKPVQTSNKSSSLSLKENGTNFKSFTWCFTVVNICGFEPNKLNSKVLSDVQLQCESKYTLGNKCFLFFSPL